MAKETIELLKNEELAAENNEMLAKNQASDIVENARALSKKAFEDKIAKANSNAKAMIFDAQNKADNEADEKKAENAAELDNLKNYASQRMDEAVNAVINKILS